MRECLHCAKELYEPKKTTKKFCKDSCRVMYHRKHGKVDTVKPMQMQVMYNAILEAITKIGQLNNLPPSSVGVVSFNQGSSVDLKKLKRRKTVEEYVLEKREINCDEDYVIWLDELMNDSFLTARQKQLAKSS